ncbi:MAG: hypothetical protein OEZ31_11670 [Nitrospirota bacterium]|nr:hypothetical protein [Nitrospirota bacterium]
MQLQNDDLKFYTRLFGVMFIVWGAVPFELSHTLFSFFILFTGPAILFSIIVSFYIFHLNNRYSAFWLIVLGSAIYHAASWLFNERGWSGFVFISGVLAAWTYLSVIRILFVRNCPWKIVFGWGSLSAIASIPFLVMTFNIEPRFLGKLWFWGLHIFLWYVTVAYAIEKMFSYHTKNEKTN